MLPLQETPNLPQPPLAGCWPAGLAPPHLAPLSQRPRCPDSQRSSCSCGKCVSHGRRCCTLWPVWLMSANTVSGIQPRIDHNSRTPTPLDKWLRGGVCRRAPSGRELPSARSCVRVGPQVHPFLSASGHRGCVFTAFAQHDKPLSEILLSACTPTSSE